MLTARDAHAHRNALPQPQKLGHHKRSGKIEGEGEFADALVQQPFLLVQLCDARAEALFDLPAHAVGEGDDMGGQQAFEEGVLIAQALEAAPVFVVVGVEGQPFMEAVVLVVGEDAQGVLAHVEAGDAHGVLGIADAEAPVGLTKKMMGFLHALIEAEEHGAHVALAGFEFVLNEGVSLVQAAGFGVVVVEPLVFIAYFAGHRAAKLRQFPGLDFSVKRHGEDSELGHWL